MTHGIDETAASVAALLAKAPAIAPDVRPLEAGPAPRRIVAIDGSSVVLAESGAHLIGAWRVGRVELRDGRAVAAPQARVEVALLADGDVTAVRNALDGGAIDLGRPTASRILDALRTLGEHRAAADATSTIGAGDLLLIDGALQVRPDAPLLDRALREAASRGVDVAGVCKSTSLTVGHAPALAACQLAARKAGLASWSCELSPPASVRGRVFAARLGGPGGRPFRFDIVAADDDPLRVLSSLAGVAGHPAYPGYPSPLAMAHNAALIADEERRRLLAQVQERALALGVPEDDWEAAFVDYHDVLELGA